MAITRRDVDRIYNAVRPRLGNRGGSGGVAAPGTIPPHTHSADQIGSNPSALVASENVQSAIEELDDEKLARSGVQPMLGDLNMDSYDVLAANDVHVENNIEMSGGIGAAIIRYARNIVMAGLGLIEQVRKIDFTGSIVGEGIVDQPRVIHMAGDDDDNEARIDGLERIVFNNEPTKSVIENPSVVQLNPAVLPGSDTVHTNGQIGWSSLEKTMVADVAADGDEVRVGLGWVMFRCIDDGEGV